MPWPLQAENDREKRLDYKQGIQKNSFDAQLKLLASQLYELHQPEQAEAYLLEAKEWQMISKRLLFA